MGIRKIGIIELMICRVLPVPINNPIVQNTDIMAMIIGGIIEDNKTETINKVPILGSIPFLGKLFQRKETNAEKTELMVFITPHIVRTPEEADEVTQAQESELTLPDRGTQ